MVYVCMYVNYVASYAYLYMHTQEGTYVEMNASTYIQEAGMK